MSAKNKKKILLHACCAPCTAGVYEQIKTDYDVILFWYNPNIFPKAEHDRRLNELLNYCDKENIKIIYGDYSWKDEHNFWLEEIKGLENEPEKGKRCEICYKIRLEATAATASQINDHHKKYDLFGAELSISPHKNSAMINQIGKELSIKYGIDFFEANFKKNDGFLKASKKSKELNLYRQTYCGCEFSVAQQDKYKN